jgi:hypothetical protein
MYMYFYVYYDFYIEIDEGLGTQPIYRVTEVIWLIFQKYVLLGTHSNASAPRCLKTKGCMQSLMFKFVWMYVRMW